MRGLYVQASFHRSGLQRNSFRLLRPQLTSALRSDRLTAPSVAEATQSRSPGVSSIAFGAQPPDLRFASLMDLDFAMCRPLVRRLRLISGFCSSARTFDPRFLQTPPRDGSPCVSLTLHLHQVGWKTFTSELLSMPGTRLNRSRGSALWRTAGPTRVSICSSGPKMQHDDIRTAKDSNDEIRTI